MIKAGLRKSGGKFRRDVPGLAASQTADPAGVSDTFFIQQDEAVIFKTS